MERKTSKKAMQIAEEIKKDYLGIPQINIYYGAPDARFPKRWWAFTKTHNGIHLGGLYGQPLRMAKTLCDLAQEGKYEYPGCGPC